MTIEQYAAEQGYKDITRYTLENGVHVYRLQNKDADKKIGLPFFALETADGTISGADGSPVSSGSASGSGSN